MDTKKANIEAYDMSKCFPRSQFDEEDDDE